MADRRLLFWNPPLLSPGFRSPGKRWRASIAVFAILGVAAAPLGLGGCTGGDDTTASDEGGSSKISKSGSSAKAKDIEEEMKELAEEVEKSQAKMLYPEEFENADKRARDVADLVRDGDVDEAARKWRSAKRSLESLVKKSKQLIARAEGVKKLQTTAAEARTAADAVEAAKYAAQYYSDANGAYQKAEEAFREPSEAGVAQAEKGFRQAEGMFRQATQIAGENKAAFELAQAERGTMEEMKKQALEAGGKEKAPDVWSLGETEENRAQAALDQGEFNAAVRSFTNAKNQYVAALQRVQIDEQFADAQAERERQRQAWLAAQQSGGPAVSGGVVLPPDLGGDTGSTPAPLPPSTGAVTVTDLTPKARCGFDQDGSWDWDDYPNQLDAEDEQFLIEHIDDLTSLGAPTYDPSTGQILLDYGVGRFVKKEADALNTSSKHLEWEDFVSRAIGDSEITAQNTYGLGGNTNGMVLFPVPFRYGVQISFDMNIQIMDPTGSFGAMVNFNPKTKRFLSTDFLNIGTNRKTQKRPAGEKGSKNANYWADKTRNVPWTITYRMPNPDQADKGPTATAQFSVTYDVGGDDETTNSVPLKGNAYENGQVGFWWNGTKFRLHNLKICGILDKAAAVNQLRAKLGIPKGSGGSKDDAEDEEDVEEVGDI